MRSRRLALESWGAEMCIGARGMERGGEGMERGGVLLLIHIERLRARVKFSRVSRPYRYKNDIVRLT